MKTRSLLIDRFLFVVLFGTAAWFGSGLLLPNQAIQSRPIERTNSLVGIPMPTTNLIILKSDPAGLAYFLTWDEVAKHIGVTNFVNGLVTNGIVCQVRGHKWQPYLDTHLVYYSGGPPQFRQCVVCEIIQSRSWPQ